MSESRQVVTTFYKGDTPPVERGYMKSFIVTVRRKPHPGRSRDVWTFAAYYLNQYGLRYEDGCGAEDCEEKHDGECPTTGWFEDNANPEYENCFYKILAEGDEVIEWAEIPGPPE